MFLWTLTKIKLNLCNLPFAIAERKKDADEESISDERFHVKKRGRRRTGRAYRREQKIKKHNRLMRLINLGHYNPAMGYVDCDFVDGERQIGNHIKYPKNSNFQRFYKNRSNRKVRRHRGSLPKGNAYRRFLDYWWDLY